MQRSMVYKDHGTCNSTIHNHTQPIPQTSWKQSETGTLSETSDVGPINLKPVSSTTTISLDAQAIISAAWRNYQNKLQQYIEKMDKLL